MGEKGAGAVHRLDRGTSGALVVARDPAAARTLSEAFERGDVEKRYLALVRGVAPEHGDLDYPVPSGPVEDGLEPPRVPARTRFSRLATAATEPRSVSLILAAPLTGRFHQVRRHLKHLSHPVIGDSTHGKGALNRAIRERYGLARLALHAIWICFPDPAQQSRSIAVFAPPPTDLTEPFRRMGFSPEVWSEDAIGRRPSAAFGRAKRAAEG